MNNNILTLEQIKNISPDDLVKAFRDGYRLSEYPECIGQNFDSGVRTLQLCSTLTVVAPTTTTTTTTTPPPTTTTTTPPPTTTTTTPPPTTTTTTPPPTTTTTTPPPTTTTTTPPPGTGSITFIVSSSGIPLSGVAISVDGSSRGTTDSIGNLTVTGLAVGVSHTYVAAKTGFNTVSSSTILDTTAKNVPINMTTTTPPAAGGGGVMIIAAIAAIGLAYFMMKKPKI